MQRIKQELAELNLSAEDWGGKTVCQEISAKQKIGIPELLDSGNKCSGNITCGKITNSSHGTAVAEIVVDMAPDVDLVLYTILMADFLKYCLFQELRIPI